MKVTVKNFMLCRHLFVRLSQENFIWSGLDLRYNRISLLICSRPMGSKWYDIICSLGEFAEMILFDRID